MDTEKTLLQQIRDKEQEFAKKIDAARADADTLVAAARSEADELLRSADQTGKKTAAQISLNVREKTAIEIEALTKAAELDLTVASERGEKNLPEAAERIIRYVTTE
jgi:vacuolar-type H+-ATPase subunit H